MPNAMFRVVLCILVALSALSIVGLEAADLTSYATSAGVIGGAIGLLAVWHGLRDKERYRKWYLLHLDIRVLKSAKPFHMQI